MASLDARGLNGFSGVPSLSAASVTASVASSGQSSSDHPFSPSSRDREPWRSPHGAGAGTNGGYPDQHFTRHNGGSQGPDGPSARDAFAGQDGRGSHVPAGHNSSMTAAASSQHMPPKSLSYPSAYDGAGTLAASSSRPDGPPRRENGSDSIQTPSRQSLGQQQQQQQQQQGHRASDSVIRASADDGMDMDTSTNGLSQLTAANLAKSSSIEMQRGGDYADGPHARADASAMRRHEHSLHSNGSNNNNNGGHWGNGTKAGRFLSSDYGSGNSGSGSGSGSDSGLGSGPISSAYSSRTGSSREDSTTRSGSSRDDSSSRERSGVGAGFSDGNHNGNGMHRRSDMDTSHVLSGIDDRGRAHDRRGGDARAHPDETHAGSDQFGRYRPGPHGSGIDAGAGADATAQAGDDSKLRHHQHHAHQQQHWQQRHPHPDYDNHGYRSDAHHVAHHEPVNNGHRPAGPGSEYVPAHPGLSPSDRSRNEDGYAVQAPRGPVPSSSLPSPRFHGGADDGGRTHHKYSPYHYHHSQHGASQHQQQQQSAQQQAQQQQQQAPQHHLHHHSQYQPY